MNLRDEVYRLHAELCQALADPTRILLLYELGGEARNVSELVNRLELSQPTVSRHLKVLRERGIVRAERDGVNMYYSLTDKRILNALDLLREVLAARLDEGQILANVLN